MTIDDLEYAVEIYNDELDDDELEITVEEYLIIRAFLHTLERRIQIAQHYDTVYYSSGAGWLPDDREMAITG